MLPLISISYPSSKLSLLVPEEHRLVLVLHKVLHVTHLVVDRHKVLLVHHRALLYPEQRRIQSVKLVKITSHFFLF